MTLRSASAPTNERGESIASAAPSPAFPETPPSAMHALVERFARAWASPNVDRFVELLHPDVRLLQPVTQPIVGREAARREFTRLLEFLPDLAGIVDRSAIDGDVALVAWRLGFTLGGRPFELRIVDRLVVADALIREREAYYDSLGFMIELLRRPRAWSSYWRYRGYLF